MAGWSRRHTPKHLAALQWLCGIAVLGACTAQAANKGSPPLRKQDVAVLAATCVTCHAPVSTRGGIPALQGQRADYLLTRMRAFKAIEPNKANADSTIMPLLLQGYDDAQIEALAQWFSTLEAQR